MSLLQRIVTKFPPGDEIVEKMFALLQEDDLKVRMLIVSALSAATKMPPVPDERFWEKAAGKQHVEAAQKWRAAWRSQRGG